jgi:hypothetical protein
MSLDKSIRHRKEHRKPYRGSKRFDSTCRNHGSCPYCAEGRHYQYKKEIQGTEDELKEYLEQ